MRTLIIGIDQSGRIIQHDRSSLEILAPPGEALLGAHLSGAHLPDADLSGANLSGTGLFKADLSGAGISPRSKSPT